MRCTIFSLLFIFFLITGCQNKNEEIPNNNPSGVTVTTSINGNSVDVSWTMANDPDDDDISYAIELNGTIVESDLTVTNYELSNLEFNESFQARLIVTDTEGGQSETSFTFATEYLFKTDGSADQEYVESAAPTDDGGVIVLARTLGSNFIGSNYGETDIIMVRYDRLGNLLWKKNYGGSQIDAPYRINKMSDSSYIITGFTNSSDGDFAMNNGSINAFALKIDIQGNIIWANTYGGSNEDVFTEVVETNDNALMFSGIVRSVDGDASANNGQSDFWVVKTTLDGSIIWEKNIGGSGADNAFSIVSNGDGTYFVGGFTRSSDLDFPNNYGGVYDGGIVKIDNDGTVVFTKNYGGTGNDRFDSMVRSDSNDGVVITGSTSSTDNDLNSTNGSTDYWVLKVDDTGEVVWSNSFGGPGTDSSRFISSNGSGTYYTCYYHDGQGGDVTESFGEIDGWYLALDENGNLTEQETFGGSDVDYINAVFSDAQGKLFVVGNTESNDFDAINNNGGYDIFLIKK